MEPKSNANGTVYMVYNDYENPNKVNVVYSQEYAKSLITLVAIKVTLFTALITAHVCRKLNNIRNRHRDSN